MDIDWPNALVGALTGWVLGFGCDRLMLWSRRTKVNFEGFASVQTNFGVLYKLRFKIKGYENPGVCSCEIKTSRFTTFAKWDEAPNPLRDDKLDDFLPEMVPLTFHQQLYVGQEYQVPIVIDAESKSFLFDAWWFGRGKGYYNHSHLTQVDPVVVAIRGNGFVWSKAFTVAEIVGCQTSHI